MTLRTANLCALIALELFILYALFTAYPPELLP